MCPSCFTKVEAWFRYKMHQARIELHELAHPGVPLVESAHSQAGGGRPRRRRRRRRPQGGLTRRDVLTRRVPCPPNPPMYVADPPTWKWVRLQINHVSGVSNSYHPKDIVLQDALDYGLSATATRYSQLRVIKGRAWGTLIPYAASGTNIISIAVPSPSNATAGAVGLYLAGEQTSGPTARPPCVAWEWGITDQGYYLDAMDNTTSLFVIESGASTGSIFVDLLAVFN